MSKIQIETAILLIKYRLINYCIIKYFRINPTYELPKTLTPEEAVQLSLDVSNCMSPFVEELSQIPTNDLSEIVTDYLDYPKGSFTSDIIKDMTAQVKERILDTAERI